MEKIAEFYDFEVFMDNQFSGEPSIFVNYMDDNVEGHINIQTGKVEGGFSKYVLPVLLGWYDEHKDILISMWDNKEIRTLPEWGE